MVLRKFSGHTDSCTHLRTHSQMDRPQCSMPLAPFFNSGGGTKTGVFIAVSTGIKSVQIAQGTTELFVVENQLTPYL